MQSWSFRSCGRLIFGSGAIRSLPEVLAESSWKRLLILTDRWLMEAGVVQRVTEALDGAHATWEVLAIGTPEPPAELVADSLAAARALKPDAILGLGGGSNMDLAKATALLFSHGGTLAQYYGDQKVPGPILPVIAVPTTAGTGSEVSGAAVLTDRNLGTKVAILSHYLRPAAAMVDPLLTVTCPPKVTADSGIDALTHAIEAFTAINYRQFEPEEPTVYQGSFPLTDLLAQEAIRLVGRYLIRAFRDGTDLEAREGMAYAATLAGLAFSNACVGLVHAMEYPVGAAVHASHGSVNGLLLPHVMRFNLDGSPRRFAQIAQWLDAATPETPDEDAAHRAVEAVERLCRQVGIPARLRDLGVSREQLKDFAIRAFAIRRLIRLNPKPLSATDVLRIYEAAY